MIDKKGLIGNLNHMDRVIIELGCGSHKVKPEAIGIDLIDSPCVDVIADINQGLSFLPDNSVDLIYSMHLLEHLENLEGAMAEIYRVLKKGGRKIGFVPHFSNPYYYSDYSHRVFFGLYTFSYFARDSQFKRKVPGHYNNIDFKINKLNLVFYSPFKGRNIIKKGCSVVFNSSTYMKELYEEIFCYAFPAHGIEFELEK